jgi:DNA-binding LacI/PurR family transcriptional regulator
MGFDDMELAVYADPPLTTIGIDKLAIGKKAAELALGCLRGESGLPGGPCILPVHLIERASTVRRE